MLQGWVILLVSFGYLCLLFAIAYYGDQRADRGRSLITPAVYSLSIAVYCTSWTFYGSVGLASQSGLSFLPIYLGPTLTFVLWWFVLRKIIRISKRNRITSIADFISARYGKSGVLSGLVTVIAVIGIMPYIALQLKAVSVSFNVLLQYPEIAMPGGTTDVPWLADTAFYVAITLAAFTILFGTRHIDASEHHEGMVCAIAFESIIKLLAFLAVGGYVVFGLFDGPGAISSAALADPDLAPLLTLNDFGQYGPWMSMTLLSMAAIICLPRQFQVTVVETSDERHLHKAVWLFPLYLLAINLFVLPIGLAGRLIFPDGSVDADTFVLTLPMLGQQEALTLFAFIGGLSAATGMVIVATIALSTMVCNDLIMPGLLRLPALKASEQVELTGLLLGIRRAAIVALILLGYIYFRYIGESYALVSIGLISFAAAAQFAPVIIGGIFWRGGTRAGALTGLSLGFLVWAYTLLMPSLAQSGWLPNGLIEHGPLGVALLRPYALFGLEGLDPITHAVLWSLSANIFGYLIVSLRTRQSPVEQIQAHAFVSVLRTPGPLHGLGYWRGSITVADIRALVGRYIGRERAEREFAAFAQANGLSLEADETADARLVGFAERVLAGAIGAASARGVIGSAVKGEVLGMDRVMEILDEATQIREYSRRLEQKSRQLELTTGELQAANERLKELDRLKDDFLATVSHELRTPLTSIRSFSEILYDTPAIETGERQQFLQVIINESDRLTRLINQILDLAKMEAGRMDWHLADLDPGRVIADSLNATRGLIRDNEVELSVDLPGWLPAVTADRDRLIQVLVNLISNAVKCCARPQGLVRVSARVRGRWLRVDVVDNGPGVPPESREQIFEKFHQIGGALPAAQPGTGLGLAICRQIIQHFGGRIWVEGAPGEGATFSFTLPIRPAEAARPAAQ